MARHYIKRIISEVCFGQPSCSPFANHPKPRQNSFDLSKIATFCGSLRCRVTWDLTFLPMGSFADDIS